MRWERSQPLDPAAGPDTSGKAGPFESTAPCSPRPPRTLPAPPGSLCDSLFDRPPRGASCLLKMPKASPSCSCPACPQLYSSVSFVSCFGPLPTLGIDLLISSPEL